MMVATTPPKVPSTTKQVTIHAPFSLPTTWATLTKNEGDISENNGSQRSTEGMCGRLQVSDACCGGDRRMNDSNLGK